MARRRYLSTDISIDEKVNSVSNFATLLYSWSIPHCADDCRLTPKSAAEIKWTIFPARKEGIDRVDSAMKELFDAGLWGRDKDGRIFIPSKSFYKYQTYINADKRRETPQNTSSSSPSPSLSPSKKKIGNPDVKIFIDWFFQEYKNKFGQPYHVNNGKDGSIVQRLLATFGLENLQKFTLDFLELDDAFIHRAGFTIGVLSSQINKITSGKAGKNVPQGWHTLKVWSEKKKQAQ